MPLHEADGVQQHHTVLAQRLNLHAGGLHLVPQGEPSKLYAEPSTEAFAFCKCDVTKLQLFKSHKQRKWFYLSPSSVLWFEAFKVLCGSFKKIFLESILGKILLLQQMPYKEL